MGGKSVTQAIDSYDHIHQVSAQLNKLESRQQIEALPDELEYLFEVTHPELQDSMCKSVEHLPFELKTSP